MTNIKSLCRSISIHAPRVGSDSGVTSFKDSKASFQSTLPVWGATSVSPVAAPGSAAISIHAPRVGSDTQDFRIRQIIRIISIHAPRVGSDLQKHIKSDIAIISIHAPRVGSDSGGKYYVFGKL